MKYTALFSHILHGTLRKRKLLIYELIIGFFLFLVLFLLLDIASSMGVALNVMSVESESSFNPVRVFLSVLRWSFFIASMTLLVYLIFYYSHYISKMMLLEKENLSARYEQVSDKSYVLAEFFGFIFLPLLIPVFLAIILSDMVSPIIIDKFSKAGYIFEYMSYQVNLVRDALFIFCFLFFVSCQFFVYKYRKNLFND